MGTMRFYEVGGCVRDALLGVHSKDVDYAVEATDYATMREFLVADDDLEIFVEKAEYFTIRARFPREVPARLAALVAPRDDLANLTVDFVLCRSDGAYSDGRRPDEVLAGTLADDLARRDFTVNAIARCADGTLVDPHDGQGDLATRTLRCVGSATDRLLEDSLRALRALRFSVTKGLAFDGDLDRALRSRWLAEELVKVDENRRRAELLLAFRYDTAATLRALSDLGEGFTAAALGDGLWLKPTNEA